jgi:hypothetical protein
MKEKRTVFAHSCMLTTIRIICAEFVHIINLLGQNYVEIVS